MTIRHDLFHQLVYFPNKWALSLLQEANTGGGRLRIDFETPEFITWRALWGHTVLFKRIEYRQYRGHFKHEFILLRAISKREACNTSHPSPASGGQDPNILPDSIPHWWKAVPDEIFEYVLKFEREPGPKYQFQGPDTSAEPFHYVDFKEFACLDSHERNSTTELAVEFSEALALEKIIRICFSISNDYHTHRYIFRGCSASFYCWNIVSILLRLHVDWVHTLQSNTMATKIVELITMRTAKLSAESQRTKAADRDVQPNLALLFAGEYDRDHSADVSPGPFVRLCRDVMERSCIFEEILLYLSQALQERFSSSLWMENGLYIVRNGVRVLLNKLADATISLAMEGTGESSVDDSFWVDGHMNGFSPEWNDLIRKEVDSLLKILVDGMWVKFNESLFEERCATSEDRSNALQRIGNSPLVLGCRLAPLVLYATWNAARLRARVSLDHSATGSSLTKMKILMRSICYVPNEIRNGVGITGNFLFVLASRRDEARRKIRREGVALTQDLTADFDSTRLSLSLGREAVLRVRMIPEIEIRRPEFGDRIFCELEKAIKNLAFSRPECTMRELRLGALEILMRIREEGRSFGFDPGPESIWRIVLWRSLGEEITRTLEEVANGGPSVKIRCWLRTSQSDTRIEERPMLVSEILLFIQSRILDLSKAIFDQGGPGATRFYQREIKNAMDRIWKSTLEAEIEKQSMGRMY
ncbi:hypothetical protein RSOLAG1IB_09103 [Rhizoctonia solani AG-1 IB]|uniref:Uncharacterized protein n=1 Tax=Thanatephorus cucumeris (strain AG1-IB / isolate 7/3/14) TaxID=1108050 RepID=A0A0B7FN75_THACB|nr:hypothetical protein RSOLAG1IB_09103 [Rhizoctonia solani AG-1 IB]